MKKSWLVLLAVVVGGYFFIEDVWPQLQVSWLKGQAAAAQQTAAIQIGVTVPSNPTTLTPPTATPVPQITNDLVPQYDASLSIDSLSGV